MKQSRLPSPAEQRNGKLLADMPCWFQKQGCVISEPKGNVNLTFRCPCSSKESGLITQTVYIGKKTDVKEIASALATAVSRKHEGCHISKTDVDDLSQEPWWDCSVQLQGARGVHRQRQLAQKKGRELAESLKPNCFVAVQDRSAEGREEHFLVGITVDCGGGSCIKRKVQEKEVIDGTRFHPGDYAIAVMWLARLAEDPEQRTFELTGEEEQFVINSTELRYVNVSLDLVPPVNAPTRRSSRGLTRAQSSGYQVLKRKYILPIESEQAILNDLW